MVAPELALSAIAEAGGHSAKRLCRERRLAARVRRYGSAIEQVSDVKTRLRFPESEGASGCHQA